MKMTCNFCGASVSGSLAEILAWDSLHRIECSDPPANTD